MQESFWNVKLRLYRDDVGMVRSARLSVSHCDPEGVALRKVMFGNSNSRTNEKGGLK